MASAAGTPPSSTSRRSTGISMQPMLQQISIWSNFEQTHARKPPTWTGLGPVVHECSKGDFFIFIPRSHKCLMHVTFGTPVSVWAVDDKWLSGYKLNFVFSSADVLFLKPFPAGFFRGGLQKLFKRFVFLYVSFQFRLSLLPRKAEKKLGWQNLNLNFLCWGKLLDILGFLIAKSICPNSRMYFSKLHNIFVQIARCICWYWKMYFWKGANVVKRDRSVWISSGSTSNCKVYW